MDFKHEERKVRNTAGTISTKKMAAAGQNIKEKKYWLKKLSGDFTKSCFYYDYPKKETNEYTPGTLEFQLTGQLFSKLNQLSNHSDPRLHMILTAGLVVLLAKYTGNNDIIVGVPVYKQELKKELLNTLLALRIPLEPHMTFKELLIIVRQNITRAVENANYPIELLPGQLNMENPAGGYFPLLDITILLENIHDKEYIRHIPHNITFSFIKKADLLTGVVEYNSQLYCRGTIERIVSHYINVFQQVLFDVERQLPGIEILSAAEKRQLLQDFNPGEIDYPRDKTLHELFEVQVQRTPGKAALCSPAELKDLFTPSACFKKNPYVYQSQLEYSYKYNKRNENQDRTQEKVNFKLLKSPHHNSVIINDNMLKLLPLFNGEDNIQTVYSRLENLEKINFIIYSPETLDMLEITHSFASKPRVFSDMTFQDFLSLVRLLYQDHLIDLVGFKTNDRNREVKKPKPGDFDAGVFYDESILLEEVLNTHQELSRLSRADVLLMGDTPGMPSTGLLYLAAFLKRNHVKTYCRFYDRASDYPSMKTGIEALLEKIQPKIVAISLKWFLYIARVLDMCQIVKAYSRRAGIPIKVVLGGNTASYYYDRLISDESVDYIIRGDGELALLKICQDENQTQIPNCVSKNKDTGEILQTPITYIKNQANSSDIYLSHLDEIMLFGNTVPFGTFFIYTHLGCGMKCIYCGGCHQAHQRSFNREKVFFRPVREARKDIIAALPYVSTFQFDFDVPIAKENLVDYCRQMWAGINLSGHFCVISRVWEFNSPGLIELAMTTFKYVYWEIDVSTLSERHRLQLAQLGLVKPQPTDQEILTFLQHCDPYENTEVRFNLIAGLPHLTLEDMESSEKFLSSLMLDHPSFSELHWARLHAQPGAPITADAQKYNMHSFASTFQDFLEYSRKNFSRQTQHQGLELLDYPYVYFNDDPLNSKISLHYTKANQKIRQYKENKRTNRAAGESLTFAQLNRKADQLARLLRTRGVASDSVVALMLTPSIEIPLTILAVLKAGGGYLPIDPHSPDQRKLYMLKDSNAALLVTTRDLIEESTKIRSWEGEKILLEDLSVPSVSSVAKKNHPHLSPAPVTSLAYIIYTSGSTGKPKGVLLTHRNLVNYVQWFTQTAQLTAEDNALLTSSFAFDLGYTALYPSLLNGASLHIIPKETYLEAEQLLSYIRRHRVTYLKVTPSLFSIIVQIPEFSAETCRHLRLVVMGGEPINPGEVKEAHRICSHMKIINHYGPTEATIGCIAQYVDFNRFEEYENNPTIGHPINNTKVYIFNRELDLQPVGVPGELCISGACLARGYLNHPELTARKFQIPGNPGNHKSYRSYKSYILYRTGDLARWMPDGAVEFLGRIDNQIKIRGYRIELGEIEDRLLKHDEIAEAAVITRENENRDRYICAYYVPGNKKIEKIKKEENKKILSLEEIGIRAKAGEPVAQAIVSRFEEQVQETPNNIAVVGSTLTYRELNEKSNRVAHIILEKYDDRCALSKRERTRYKRQMLLNGWGIESQEKLKSTTVFVAGAGGGASATIMQLALAGFGTLIVCDYDHVELSNLNRQFLHDESRIGMNKALSAKITINQVNPHVHVIPITKKLTRENSFELVGDSAVIFDMFDGQADKFILSECAAAKGIPHIISAMTDISSYAVIFHPPHTPCFHCLFDKTKFEELVSGMKNTVADYEKNPLPVAAPSLFVSTGFAVNEAIKIILGLKNPAYNKYFFFNQGGAENIAASDSFRAMTYTYSDHFRRICQEQGFDWDIGWHGKFLAELAIAPNPDCPVCGEKGKERLTALKEKLKSEIHVQPKINSSEDKKLQTVALLTNHSLWLPMGIMGILKSRKNYLHLPPTASQDQQLRSLENSEARFILTDKENFSRAEKIRNTYNKNIPITVIDKIDEAVKSENPDIQVEPGETAIRSLDAAMTPLYAALLKGDTYDPTQQEQRKNTFPLSQLRDYLLQSLPEYMIPSYFVQLLQMPLTPNGKLDKKALPAPEIKAGDNYTAPRNNLEKKLAAIWSGVLRIEEGSISIDANFFELGGHSLKATALVANIHKECNARVPLTEIFNHPTIKGISGYIRNTSNDKYAAIEPVEKNEYYVSSSNQKRLYLIQRMDPENIAYNLPNIIPLEVKPNKKKLEETFTKLIKRHESLRTSFAMIGEEPVQRVHNEVNFEIEIYSPKPGAQGEQDLDSTISNFVRPFDLSQAPLLRVGLIHTLPPGHHHFSQEGSDTPRLLHSHPSREGRSILMVDMHHIISDAISHQVLRKDFMTLDSGEELPDLKIQYKDYCQWLNSKETKETMKKQEEYWLKQFEGKIPRLDLPTDYERPAVQSYEGNMLGFVLGEEETAKLKKCAAEEEATLYMILLAVFTILLSKITGGQEDIVVGTGTAGRGHADLQGMIGMFVNTLAMRNYPAGNKTFKEFLTEVRKRTLPAFENQDYPFEELVEKLVPDRDWSRPPLVETVFVMQDMENDPGEITQWENQNIIRTSMFDITLTAMEAGEKLFFNIEYCTKLFKKETIEMFIENFKKIVSSVMDDKDIRLKNIAFTNGLAAIKSNIIREEESDFAF